MTTAINNQAPDAAKIGTLIANAVEKAINEVIADLKKTDKPVEKVENQKKAGGEFLLPEAED